MKLIGVKADGEVQDGVLEVRDGKLVITFAKALSSGKYTVSLTIAGNTYVTEATVEIQEPETPETPEKPENPEAPETPENP